MVRRTRADRGSILAIACILTILIMGMAVALLKSAAQNKKSTIIGEQWDQALDVAEAGIDYTVESMNNWKAGQSFTTMSTSFSTGSSATVSFYDPQQLPKLVLKAFAGGPLASPAQPQPWSWALQATGIVGRYTGMTGTKHTITVVVQATFNGVWQYGLFSWQTLNLSSNETSDSWISGPPPVGSPVYDRSGFPTVYDNQATNSYGSHSYASANVTDGSNNNIVFANSNNYVFGNAIPGPGDSVTLSGAYVSGSTAPAQTPFSFPSITVPAFASLGALAVGKGPPVSITGNVHYSSISTVSGSNFTIKGPATVVVDSLTMDSNTSFTLDDSGGPIQIYGTGVFSMAANTSTLGPTSGVPANLQVYITTDNYTGFTDPKKFPNGNPAVPVGFASNNALVGAIYAPKAVVALPSNYSSFGSVVAQALGPASNFKEHFDQNLAPIGGGPPTYKMQTWFENPADR